MQRTKKLSKLLVSLLVAMCLFTYCGKKSILDTLNNMYDEGIEQLQKAESKEDVQNIYDEVSQQIKDFMTEHEKEFTALDSSVTALQKAEEAFIKACCMKSEEFDSGIQTDKGLARLDESGNVFIEDNQGKNNPLNIIGYSYIYLNGNIEEITLSTPNGVYLYNEEDAERYYDYYVPHFFLANMIVRRVWYSDAMDETKKYVKKHLFEIVSNLPIDINSHPKDVVDKVNNVFFNYLENAKKIYLIHRDNEKSIYGYGGPTKLYLCRDPDHGGKLVIYDR